MLFAVGLRGDDVSGKWSAVECDGFDTAGNAAGIFNLDIIYASAEPASHMV